MGRLFLVLGTILLLLTACGETKLDYPSRQMPIGITTDQQGLAWAAKTFIAKCAYCHGHENEGRGPRAVFFEPPAPDFLETEYRTKDPAYLFWRIAEGKTVEPFLSRGSVMPAWGVHFSERETWLLIVFIKQRATLK